MPQQRQHLSRGQPHIPVARPTPSWHISYYHHHLMPADAAVWGCCCCCCQGVRGVTYSAKIKDTLAVCIINLLAVTSSWRIYTLCVDFHFSTSSSSRPLGTGLQHSIRFVTFVIHFMPLLTALWQPLFKYAWVCVCVLAEVSALERWIWAAVEAAAVTEADVLSM